MNLVLVVQHWIIFDCVVTLQMDLKKKKVVLLSKTVSYIVLSQAYNVVETTQENFIINFEKSLLQKFRLFHHQLPLSMANTDKFSICNCVWFTKPQFLCYLFKFHLVDVWSWNFLQRQVLDKITFDSFLRCFDCRTKCKWLSQYSNKFALYLY